MLIGSRSKFSKISRTKTLNSSFRCALALSIATLAICCVTRDLEFARTPTPALYFLRDLVKAMRRKAGYLLT